MLTKIGSALAGAILVGVGFSGTAEAITLNFDSTSASTNTPATGASAQVDFDFVDVANGVQLDLTLLNTTGVSPFGLGATDSKFVAFGFDIPDTISSFTYNGLSSSFTRLFTDAVIGGLGGQNVFDIGIRVSGNGTFAGGNPTGGLNAGESAQVRFLFNTPDSAQDLETAFTTLFAENTFHAVARFQAVEGPNFQGASDKLFFSSLSEEPEEPESVPEPTSLLGLLAIGAVAASSALKKKAAV